MIPRRIFAFLLLICFFLYTGCAPVAHLAESYERLGVSKDARMSQLEGNVQDFHEALYWGKVNRVLELALEESHDELRKEMRARKRKEHFVDSTIELVEFSDDAYEADVDVLVRYYKIPFYVVRERLEKQAWRFSIGNGWKYVSRDELEMG